MCLLTRAAKVPLRDATDLQYQILSINMISHIATAADHEIPQGSYVARGSKLAKRQKAHTVIEVIINACLTIRLYSSKFYSSKSLTTPFVKILHHQTLAPYGITDQYVCWLFNLM